MNEEVIYPSMVIRSQAEAIELLEKENQKYKEVINKVTSRLEYFLIGNLKYQSSQEEFIKLLIILKEVE